MSATKLPASTIGRLHILPQGMAFPFAVIAATEAAHAVPEAMARRGQLSTHLTHDAGVVQPDARGWALAYAIIEGGGTALFGFATLADAMAFKRILDGAAA